MPEVLILIACLTLLALSLGLPLLLKPDSLVPDIIALGILAVAILAFVWATGAYWMTLPMSAIVPFVAWLDGAGQKRPTPLGTGATGASDRTRLRLRLWRAAKGVQLALVVCLVISFAAGFTRFLGLTAQWAVIAMVATQAFRFSFSRSCRHDRRALAGEAAATKYWG